MTQRLRAVLRDHDMLSRFGGDEFIVMLSQYASDSTPADIAERLRAEIARPLTVDGVELFVTGSIGIAVADRADVTASELLRDADAAMYRAKARGRDCVEIFAQGVHDASVIALRTTNELRRGIERDEIVPYYQPIVDLRHRRADRLRGARPLAASRSRPAGPRSVPADGRGDRPDQRPRRGHSAGVAGATRAVARACRVVRRPQPGGQRQQPAVAGDGLPRGGVRGTGRGRCTGRTCCGSRSPRPPS